MDHDFISEHGLIERYHQGLLAPEEEARFEEHFVTCADCMEQLELARGFERGLKAVVAEDAAKAVVQAGLFAWLARRSRAAQWGLGMAALLLAAGLAAFWPLSQGRDLRQTAAGWRARWQTERQGAADLERRLAASERRRDDERRELEARLAQAREQPAGLRGILERPLANLPVVLLSAVRGGAGDAPVTIDRTQAGAPLALAVDVGDDPRYAGYRVTITGKGGAAVFSQAGLQPNALETLLITFPAGFFADGDYRLRVDGTRSAGGTDEILAVPFRVVGKR